MDILLLIIGLALIVFGANFLTDGSSSLASRMGISEFMVGLTVVAIGTSMPELIVSVMSAAAGKSDMAIGNVLGSNLFNVLFILGVTSLVKPLPLTGNNLRKDIPFMAVASAVFLLMISDKVLFGASGGVISRWEGIVLLALFGAFMAYTILFAKKKQPEPILSNHDIISAANGKPAKQPQKLWLSIVMVAGGLAGLIFGGNLFLGSATSLARSLGVSDSVIAITLLAGGTSIPELAASVVAAAKGRTEIALGNVIGSNIANIFLVLGTSAVVSPLTAGNIFPIDGVVLVATSLVLMLTAFSFRRHTLDRFEGALFIAAYVGYIFWIVNR